MNFTLTFCCCRSPVFDIGIKKAHFYFVLFCFTCTHDGLGWAGPLHIALATLEKLKNHQLYLAFLYFCLTFHHLFPSLLHQYSLQGGSSNHHSVCPLFDHLQRKKVKSRNLSISFSVDAQCSLKPCITMTNNCSILNSK